MIAEGRAGREWSTDYLVGLEEEGWEDGEVEGFGGLEVNDQLALHRLLYSASRYS